MKRFLLVAVVLALSGIEAHAKGPVRRFLFGDSTCANGTCAQQPTYYAPAPTYTVAQPAPSQVAPAAYTAPAPAQPACVGGNCPQYAQPQRTGWYLGKNLGW